VKRYDELNNSLERSIQIKDKSGNVLAHFTIYGKCGENNECFGSKNTCHMTISIDDKYHNRKWSTKLIYYMIISIQKEIDITNQLLFIDADGSGGFWDHIGMIEYKYGYDYDSSLDLTSEELSDMELMKLHLTHEEYEDGMRIVNKMKQIEGLGYEKVISFKTLIEYIEKH